MTQSSAHERFVTSINTFTVAPEKQERAAQLLTEVAEKISRTVPGFLSATFHKSVDGTRVVGYARYTSVEAVKAGMARILESDAPFLAELREIASPEPRIYDTYAQVTA